MHAISARAQWVDSNRIHVKLSPGLFINANLKFSLVDISKTLQPSGITSLPVVSSNGVWVSLSTTNLSATDIAYLITRPLNLVVTDPQQQILDATAIQYAGVLDQLFYYEGTDLGGRCDSSSCQIKLWAPTAQNVRVHFFADSSSPAVQTLDCQRNESGVWSLDLQNGFKNYYYLYEVQVYQPYTNRIEHHLVTDPYSLSLSLNGERSQLIDLNSSETKPAGWDYLQKPYLDSTKDSVIYELHLRDFSAQDPTTPAYSQGTYLAFAEQSQGAQHLRELAEAGLTHLHILPFNDFGSVNEVKSLWPVADTSPSSDLSRVQDQIGQIRTEDSYNWGYDPVHYFTPEGSYAVNGDGYSRVQEARQMIQSINQMGLRVIQDVVFNHTYQNALEPYSVFDKIVPLYYYRLTEDGLTHTSSCCADTASEHRMMEKLILESVLSWARNYKLDGFRFDLMSFHSRSTILRIRDELRALTLSEDGVDGSKMLIYGEGWTFGSFYNSHPDEAMTHENSFGSGIGFFNDRLRDAARGGTTNSSEKSDQGFATGLYFDFNQEPANRNTPVDLPSQYGKLLHLGDVIKVGLAGNLRDLAFRDHLGNTITGYSLRFRGQPVAYGAVAEESINYVSAHDGYPLWDAIQAKAPFYTSGRSPETASAEDRQRMQQLLLALPLLGQSIPFIESGSELLRSKNGDQDSYNSGDFFNRIDWSGHENFWGEALPPAWKNQADWSFWEPRLRTPELRATPALVSQTKGYFKALLRVRQSSGLFKLNTPAEIANHLRFIDNDSNAEAGLIALYLQNSQESLVIFINASREGRIFNHDLLKRSWQLHPFFDEQIDAVLSEVQINSSLGSIWIPGRSTVILKGAGAKKR